MEIYVLIFWCHQYWGTVTPEKCSCYDYICLGKTKSVKSVFERVHEIIAAARAAEPLGDFLFLPDLPHQIIQSADSSRTWGNNSEQSSSLPAPVWTYTSPSCHFNFLSLPDDKNTMNSTD